MNTLIVGLGNPGPFYANTRHQIGQVAVEMVADILALQLKATQNVGRTTTKSWVQEDHETLNYLTLQVPTVGMNDSGSQIKSLIDFIDKAQQNIKKYDRIIVLHDDMAIPFGQIRLKKNSGNHAGNNGIRSIVAEGIVFTQLKIGIGPPAEGRTTLQHALSHFEPEELAVLHPIIFAAADLALRCATEEVGATTINVLENGTTLPSSEKEASV